MKHAKITACKHFDIGKIDSNLFGSFVEHMGRTVYTGIYEPTHPSADEDCFRTDVIKAIKGMGVTNLRYPGGNYVSCHNWTDGVGKQRVPRLELAWGAVEPNTFGLNEFMKFAQKVNVMPILAVNLGTRGIEDALNLLEYCNHPCGTYFSEMRKEHGITKPYSVNTWCLGNEMDGDWQIGHKTADEYGRLAAECAKAMKRVDPGIKLASCGSSASYIDTYPEWDITTLEHTYEYVDYISIHHYYGGQEKGILEFLSQSQNMDKYIKTIASVCDIVKEKKNSEKDLFISFDEWGVWNFPSIRNADAKEKWQTAPRHSEMIYTFEDMLLFASMMMTLLKNCNRVKIACQSVLTNVSAAIMTEPGGDCWLQPIYFPFSHMAKYAKGNVLQLQLDCPSYSSENGTVPYLDVVCTQDMKNKEIVFFVVNRNPDEDYKVNVQLHGLNPIAIVQRIEMRCNEVKADNFDNHENIKPVYYNDRIELNGICELMISKLSWNVFRLECEEE